MDLSQYSLTSIFTRLSERINRVGDSEPEQAIHIRLSIALALIVYFCIPWGKNETFEQVFFSVPGLMAVAYFTISLIIASWVIIHPYPSPKRRVAGILLDLLTVSYMMYRAEDQTVFLYIMYLWVILGNGFRYGTKYLYIASLVGISGFLVAIIYGPYWQYQHLNAIGYTLLLLLFSIPLYCAFLIDKLHTAISDAKFANQAKSRFLANMSHELRTPLNGVIGVADLLEETKLDNPQQELVSIMRNSANTLLGLIENVLDISKIEAGKIVIKNHDFDLHQLVGNIIHMQSPMGKAKGIHVCTAIDANIPYLLKGDAQHLRQVIINLVGNAIKFTSEGSVKLLLNLVDREYDKIKIRFDVVDTGVGIPDNAIENIFDDFTQAQSNNLTEGTGLGTTISKQLVELMGGEIGVESQLNHGSRFWFEMTFATSSQNNVSLSDEKILILADDQTSQQLSHTLSSWSVETVTASSSAQALNQLMDATASDAPFTIMLIEQSKMMDIEPVKYARMLYSEKSLENLSLILINHERAVVADPELNTYYISSVEDISDKPVLFNALHAAQPVFHQDSKVVKLADQYAQQNQQTLNILIAEDNLVNQKVISGLLTNLGHQVQLVDDGEKALDLLSTNIDNIDLLILDMNLPLYTGVEIMQALPFITTKHIPTIMLTADATPEAQEKSLAAGVDVFMTKPINSRQLINEIVRLTDAKQPAATPAATNTTVEQDNPYLDLRLIAELQQLGSGNPDFFASLVDSFKEDASKHLNIIQSAVKDDYLALRESLHALKGSSTEMGAIKLATLCKQGEASQPEQINSATLLQLANELEQAYLAAVSELNKLLNDAHATQPHRRV